MSTILFDRQDGETLAVIVGEASLEQAVESYIKTVDPGSLDDPEYYWDDTTNTHLSFQEFLSNSELVQENFSLLKILTITA